MCRIFLCRIMSYSHIQRRSRFMALTLCSSYKLSWYFKQTWLNQFFPVTFPFSRWHELCVTFGWLSYFVSTSAFFLCLERLHHARYAAWIKDLVLKISLIVSPTVQFSAYRPRHRASLILTVYVWSDFAQGWTKNDSCFRHSNSDHSELTWTWTATGLLWITTYHRLWNGKYVNRYIINMHLQSHLQYYQRIQM